MSCRDIRRQIRDAVVPMPILFNEDLSIDHESLGQYTEWLIENGMTNFCLTFVYSILDSITTQEIIDVTRTIANVVSNSGVFLSCTAGGPIKEVVKTVNNMKQAGADGVFVHPPGFVLQGGSGDIYVNYLSEVLKQTDVPILSVALPNPWQSLKTPMLSLKHYELLVGYENYIGFKDDIYQIPLRQQIAERFGERLCIIGGGDLKKYVVNSHLPAQSEFAGMMNPIKQKEIFRLLKNNNYNDAISMIEEDGRSTYYDVVDGLHWLAILYVKLWAMGIAKTYRLRLPIKSATQEQANKILNKLRENRSYYERSIASSPKDYS